MTEPPIFPRPAPAETVERADASPRRPFARLVGAPTARRLALGRLAWGLLAAGIAVVLLGLGGIRGWRAALDWLHGRPQFTLPFAAITLDPPPPAWIKPGAAGLLESVRTTAGRPETLRVQGEDLAALARDFQRESPWVRSVQGIETSYPNRLVVRLEYRRPVAFVQSLHRRIILDRDGVVLPNREVDRSACGPLVPIVPEGEASVAEARAGRLLRFGTNGDGSPGDPGPAQAAARVAGFLTDQQATASRIPAVRAVQLYEGKIWVDLDGDRQVLWSTVGNDPPGEPSPERKWAALQEWFAQNASATLESPSYLTFDRDRAIVRRPAGKGR